MIENLIKYSTSDVQITVVFINKEQKTLYLAPTKTIKEVKQSINRHFEAQYRPEQTVLLFNNKIQKNKT